MASEALRIDNLSSGYGARRVIKDLSMVIEEGSVVGIIGPNGHGKSTLVKTISGLISNMEGKIYLKNISIDDLSTNERVEKGLIQIPQGDLIFPDILSPLEWLFANSSQGFGWHCFMPNDNLLLSSSISRIITSTSSPN